MSQPAAGTPAPFQPLVVTGVGALSPVGDNVAQTCSSIRTSISGCCDHDSYWGRALYPEWQLEEPVKVAAVRSVASDLEGRDRLLALLLPALGELIDTAGLRRADMERSALLLALPALDDVVAAWGLDDVFVPELRDRAGLVVQQILVDQSGHCGVFQLLSQASSLLHARQIDQCIVGAVDSYLSEDRLALLDAAWRVKSPRNVDGFIPGEAAVALLLETPRYAASRGATTALHISALAFGSEPNHATSERTSTATGLSQAIRGVLPDTTATPCRWVLCDLNGESYRAYEWGTVLTRLSAQFPGTRKLVHPADCLGDVGSATGGVLLASAAAGFGRDYAAADQALLWAASDSTMRAAALVSAAPS